MKKILLTIFPAMMFASLSYGQYSSVVADPSFRYVATPGFVSVTELTGALGLKDTAATNAEYYLGISNVFGYQIDRHFFGGIGIGYHYFNDGYLIPVYLEYKYSMYLKRFTPYFYGDGGTLIHLTNFEDESKIFVNPGLGISRAISPQLELSLSAGYMIQARSTLTRITFVNFKLGITFRNNSFRMFRNEKTL